MQLHQNNWEQNSLENFRIKCKKCSGLCCVALYFSKFDGFPGDKEAGVPCGNLDSGFHCIIHEELSVKRMKGCIAYDCCGAGQIVTSMYKGADWKTNPQNAGEIFDVFIKVYYLQQMLWYLTEAKALLPARELWEKICIYIDRIKGILQPSPKAVLQFAIEDIREDIGILLTEAGRLVRKKVCGLNETVKRKDFVGYQFKKAQLDGCDFSSSLLIASDLSGCSLAGSNFIGTDLRDTNIKNADLSESIFLTQGQINTAIGNKGTRIPVHLVRPKTWL